jgi:hypothetical protein
MYAQLRGARSSTRTLISHRDENLELKKCTFYNFLRRMQQQLKVKMDTLFKGNPD